MKCLIREVTKVKDKKVERRIGKRNKEFVLDVRFLLTNEILSPS
jgi:hypothetical protein